VFPREKNQVVELPEVAVEPKEEAKEATSTPSEPQSETTPAPTATPQQAVLPAKADLTVPFLVQAPYANWDPLHEDACEEASLIMVKHFRAGEQGLMPVATGEEEILDLVDYENNHNYGVSITLRQLSTIANDYYGMSTGRVVQNITPEMIKREIAAGRPVIIPAAGKVLPNPNFRNGGPIYHMLVVVGYDGDTFITNDPGTRNGRGFTYTSASLIDSIHDWNSSDILEGSESYLVFD